MKNQYDKFEVSLRSLSWKSLLRRRKQALRELEKISNRLQSEVRPSFKAVLDRKVKHWRAMAVLVEAEVVVRGSEAEKALVGLTIRQLQRKLDRAANTHQRAARRRERAATCALAERGCQENYYFNQYKLIEKVLSTKQTQQIT